jgi:hypothetical protein
MPGIRKIVNDAKNKNYRFSQLILGVVNSQPFQLRAKPMNNAPSNAAQVARN